MNQIHVRPISLAAFTAIALALCGVVGGDAGLSSWLASAGAAVVEEAPAPQVDGYTGAGAAEAP